MSVTDTDTDPDVKEYTGEGKTQENIVAFFQKDPYSTYLQLFKKSHLKNDILQGKDFDSIIEHITKGEHIDNVSHFLCSINQYANKTQHPIVNPRIFFTTYLISYHSKIILDVDEDKDIFELSSILLHHVNAFLEKINEENFDNLYKCIINYRKLFYLWKNKDKKRIIHNLAKSYWDIESNMIVELQGSSEENKKLWLECSREEQRMIIDRVMELGGEEALEYFNSLVPVMVNEDFINNVDTIMKDAFWNTLKDELSGDEPNYMSIIPILEDTKKLFVSCIPSSQTKMIKEIDEYINVSLFKQMIEHDAFDNETIVDLINYIFELLMSLDCEIYDEENIEWKDNLIKDIYDEKPFYDIFPSFFKLLFLKLEELKKNIDILRMCAEIS